MKKIAYLCLVLILGVIPNLIGGYVFASVESNAPNLPVNAPTLSTTTYYVDAINGSNTTGNGSAGNPWKTITYALSQTFGSNLEIHVAAGTYNTTLGENFPIVMKSGISLIGASYTTTVIMGVSGSYVVNFPGITAYPSSTVLSGFKIMNGSEGVRIEGYTSNSSSPTIQFNWITSNTYGLTPSAGSGYPYQGALIRNNLISNNTYGIHIGAWRGAAVPAPQLEGNTIISNTNVGVYCYGTGSGYPYNGDYGYCMPTLIGNTIANNGSHGFICHTAYTGGCSPTFIGNTIANNNGWGIARQHDVTYLAPTSPQFFNNIIYGNASGGRSFHQLLRHHLWCSGSSDVHQQHHCLQWHVWHSRRVSHQHHEQHRVGPHQRLECGKQRRQLLRCGSRHLRGHEQQHLG